MPIEHIPYSSQCYYRAMQAAKPRRFPPSARVKKPSPPPDFTEHAAMIRERRKVVNRRVWRHFLACGFNRAWEYVHGEAPACPDLTLEADDFLQALGLNLMGMRGETMLEWQLRERIAAFERAQRRRELALRALARHARRAHLLLAIPPWADRTALRTVYLVCRERNYGLQRKRFAVRHLVPLEHPLVCGLHVPWNLRIVMGVANHQHPSDFATTLARSTEPSIDSQMTG